MTPMRGVAWQHALLAASALVWSGLLANAFALEPRKWLTTALAIVFTFFLLMDVLLAIFLRQRTAAKKHALIAPFLWLVIVSSASDFALGWLYSLPRGLAFLQPPDPLLGWAMRPKVENFSLQMGTKREMISTDSLGFRNNLPYPADGRILCAVQGDSNVFGFGLAFDDTLCEHLNRLLGGGIYNFGVCGYDTNHFFFQYEQLAKVLKPAVRLIVFNTGNDFSAAALATPYYYPRPYLMAVSYTHLTLPTIYSV
mgnify:CR=1 FL=1